MENTTQTRADELFDRTFDLQQEYSATEILETLAGYAACESEDFDLCSRCRIVAKRLETELDQLVDRMEEFKA